MASVGKMEDGWVRAKTHTAIRAERDRWMRKAEADAKRALAAERALAERVEYAKSVGLSLEATAHRADEAEARAVGAESTVEVLSGTIAKLRGELLLQDEAAGTLDRLLTEARVNLTERETRIEEHRTTIGQQAAALDACRELASSRLDTMAEQRRHLMGLQTQVSELRQERDDARNALREAERDTAGRRYEIADMGRTIARMEGFIEAQAGAKWPGDGVRTLSVAETIEAVLHGDRPMARKGDDNLNTVDRRR